MILVVLRNAIAWFERILNLLLIYIIKDFFFLFKIFVTGFLNCFSCNSMFNVFALVVSK